MATNTKTKQLIKKLDKCRACCYNINMIHHKEIIVGSSLPALIFAINKSIPIFYSEFDRPFYFDCINPKVNLDFLGLENVPKILKGIKKQKTVGIKKEIIWERLLFLLSFCGYAPTSDMCHSMRYDGKSLVLNDEFSKIGEVTFDKCYYFGDKNCQNLVTQKNITKKYLCYDWMAFNTGGKHEYDYIKTKDDFVNEILFYISTRRLGNSTIKDACAISRLTMEQLSDFDYSETMARFKTVYEMKERGMRARISEYDEFGNPKKYKLYKTSYLKRDLIPMNAEYKPLSEKVVIKKSKYKITDLSKENVFIETLRKLF